MLLKNKTIMITGASRGIGRATAEIFAKEKASLILLSRNFTLLESLRKKIMTKYKTRVLIYKADIRNYNDLKEVFNDLFKKKISLDCLINNAGILKDSTLQMAKIDMIKDIYETNVFGTIMTSQLALNSLIKNKKGSIVNVSSIVGISGNAGQTIYASSKSAIIGFTKSLSKELAPLNIRVNAVAPGFIKTDMTKGIDRKFYDKNINSIGMRRIGEPEDVAKTLLFLASDLSEYITGQVIGVDGGMII